MTIKPFCNTWMSVNMSLLENRDFIFYSISKSETITLYYHIMNISTTKLIIKNNSLSSIQISNRFKLRIVSELQYNNSFFDATELSLAMWSHK